MCREGVAGRTALLKALFMAFTSLADLPAPTIRRFPAPSRRSGFRSTINAPRAAGQAKASGLRCGRAPAISSPTGLGQSQAAHVPPALLLGRVFLSAPFS